jgi:hypothetical protein
MESLTRPPTIGPAFAPPARLEPTRVKIAGPLHGVAFPAACARCGAPARDTLRVDKMFRHTYADSPTRHEFARLQQSPVLRPTGLAERDVQPVDPALLRRLRRTFVLRCLPYVVPVGVLLFLTSRMLGPFGRTLFGPPGLEMLIGAGVLGFLGLSLAGFVHLLLKARHALRADGPGTDPNDTYVRTVPILLGGSAVITELPTPVLAAADYTTNVGELFEGERHTFTFADPVFAAQFAALNADRVWDARAPKARRARWLRKVTIAAIVLFGLYTMLRDWL